MAQGKPIKGIRKVLYFYLDGDYMNIQTDL